MSDAVGYVLILGAVVIPGYLAILLAEDILLTVFENQSILLSFGFP
jgi:hypothetical protein